MFDGKTQFNANVKMVRSDNGSEFISGPMKKFYGDQGIVHKISCVGIPQQNGIVERKHRHILNVVRALRSKLIYLWNSGGSVF